MYSSIDGMESPFLHVPSSPSFILLPLDIYIPTFSFFFTPFAPVSTFIFVSFLFTLSLLREPLLRRVHILSFFTLTMPMSPPSPGSSSSSSRSTAPSPIAATSSAPPPLLSRGLPRLLMTGVLWITLVMTAAQLFVLSHVGFIVLNCFSHLTAPPSTRGYSPRNLQREEEEEEDEENPLLTGNSLSRLPTSPSPFSAPYPTRSPTTFRRYMQSNNQAANQAANAGAVKKTIPRDEWNARLSEVQVDRE